MIDWYNPRHIIVSDIILFIIRLGVIKLPQNNRNKRWYDNKFCEYKIPYLNVCSYSEQQVIIDWTY
jgi:hypothetical protein